MEGDELTAASSPVSNESEQSEVCFADTLDKWCAYYMTLGVPCDEFWNGDYTLLKYYVDAHKYAVDRRNEELWLQGMYFYHAISVALSNAFDKHSKTRYPDKPYQLTEPSEEQKERENQKKIDDFRASLMALGKRMEAKHKREQGGENLGSRKPNIQCQTDG